MFVTLTSAEDRPVSVNAKLVRYVSQGEAQGRPVCALNFDAEHAIVVWGNLSEILMQLQPAS